MKIKILIGFLIVFMIIGTASAVAAKDFETPAGYEKEADGHYFLISDGNQHLYIDSFKTDDIFKNSTDYKVHHLGDNLYAFEDTGFESYGIQEKVTFDGKDYLVSLSKKDPLTDKEMSKFKEELKSFNELNKVKAMPV